MIIHSPEISGSLTLVGGAVIKDPVFSGSVSSVGDTGNSVYSGSFSGSINGIGDPETFSASIATDFSNLSSDFDELTNNPFTQSVSAVTITKDLLPNDSNIDLGSPSQPFKDLYLSSASLYIDGNQVLSSDSTELTLTTTVGQSLKLLETSADTVQIQTENGDITLTSTGTGNLELDAPIQIVAGNQILSSDGNAIQFGEDIDITGNITVSGTVDAVDIAAFKSSFDTLEGKSLVSGSSQVALSGVTGDTDDVTEGASNLYYTDARVKTKLDAETVVSGSDQVLDILSSVNSFTSSVETGLSFSGANVTVLGNLDVQGTTTTVDSTTVQIGDNIIELNGTGATNGGMYVSDPTAPNTITGSLLWDSTNDYWVAGQIGSESKILTVDDTDNTVQFSKVGINTGSDATYELKVDGDIGATGDIVAYISSDERLKNNIQLIENPIQKVEQLRGVTWEWNDEASPAAKASPNVGVIAQDVERVLPQLVHDRENGYKGVDYSKLTGLLIEAMKEQQQQLDEMRERLSQLEG